MRSCFHAGMPAIVRMLCRRSHNLMIRTRTSLAIATNILRKRRGLLGFLRVEPQAVELGDAVDDGGDIGPELGLDLAERERRVLDRIVEQRSGDRDLVEAETGHDRGDGQRVGDVRLAALAALRCVGDGGHLVRPPNHGDLFVATGTVEVDDERRDLLEVS